MPNSDWQMAITWKEYKSIWRMANGDWRLATVVVTSKGERGKLVFFSIALWMFCLQFRKRGNDQRSQSNSVTSADGQTNPANSSKPMVCWQYNYITPAKSVLKMRARKNKNLLKMTIFYNYYIIIRSSCQVSGKIMTKINRVIRPWKVAY